MIVKYYLSVNIKAPFEDFALDLRNAWADPTNKRTCGAFIAAVFSMQGFGILAASTVTMVVCSIFDHVSHNVSKDPTPMAVDFAWRLILMLGAVPAGLTCYWRMTMTETARY